MKDIYALLNDVNVNLEDLAKTELTGKEKSMVLKSLKTGRSRGLKNTGRALIAAAAIILVAIGLFNDSINAVAKETVASIIEIFRGNSAKDYSEQINTVVESDGVKMDLIKAEREDGEIRVEYQLIFDGDISVFKTMGENQGYKVRSVYYTDAFSGCDIYIDGRDINDIINSYNIETEAFYYYEVNDVSISAHELKQELVIYLNDKDYNKDMNIKLDFKNIQVGDNLYPGPVTAEYDLVAGKYTGEVEKSDLSIDAVSLNGTGFHITGYAFTNTGLKVYADLITGPEGAEAAPVVYFKAVDNLGNQYLYYPIYDINDQSKMTFYLYDGPADEYNEYDDYLAEGASSMTLTLYEAVWDFETYIKSESKMCDEFTLELGQSSTN